MNEGSKGFKTALVGGFAREDVLEYITETAKHNGEARKKLEQNLDTAREELSELRDTNGQLSQKNAELLERLGTLTLQNEALKRQAEQAEARATKAEQQQAAISAQMEQVQTDLTIQLSQEQSAHAQAKAKIEKLEKQCEEYGVAKQRLAEIELCAHRRAKEINEHAQYDERRIRQQAAELITGAKKELMKVCDVWRETLVQAANDAAEQTRRAQELLERMDRTTEVLDEAMVGQLDRKEDAKHATMDDAIALLTESQDSEG